MQLPVEFPLKPMLAKRVDNIPPGDGWLFEPKWDGFRTLVFRDGDELTIQSRARKSLNRYFPELLTPLKAQLPQRCVLDGELVIARNGGLDFEALQMRIHPAASRVKMLSETIPAAVVFWDMLCSGDEDLREQPLSLRRERLLAALPAPVAPLFLTPVTLDPKTASDWFTRFEGAGFDGVMAKSLDGSYQPNKRSMLKVKHKRTADCVVAGFRWHKNGPGTMVGSLMLGLHNEQGALQHIGVAASFKEQVRRDLVELLAPYRENALEGHPWAGWMDEEAQQKQRLPGGKSRWSAGKDLSWNPVRAELVCEVSYDHMQGKRFRHTAHFVRWRTDKPPQACDYEQLDVTPPYEIDKIFGRPTST